MDIRNLVPVMNDTKWNELRLAMYELRDLGPKWRTKDIETGFIPMWDGEWFDHFREGGYESIGWVEIQITSDEQEHAVLKELVRIHVPGERNQEGFRIYGYAKLGEQVEYIE